MLCAFGSPAQSQSLGASYTYTVPQGSPATSLNTGLNSVPADIGAGGSDSSGDSVFGHYYAYSTGSFGSRSSGSGNFTINGTAVYSSSFVAATTGDYYFNYTITGGQLGVNLQGTATGSQFASLSAKILETINAAPATTLLNYQSSMTVASTTATPVFAETGGTLNAAGPTLSAGSGDYTWSDQSNSAYLGLLIAGESVNVLYTLTSDAEGTTSSCGAVPIGRASVTGYGGYGGYGGSCLGSAIARIGDPVTLSNSPVPFDVTVPEPTTAVVLGAGLAGLAFSRRRKAA